jgi:hypothetical protein
MSPAFAPAYAFASSRPGSRLLRAPVPLDRKILVATRGRYSLFGPITLRTLLLTTTGRKSGRPRAIFGCSPCRGGGSNRWDE